MSTTRPPFSLLSVASNRERHKLASDEPWILLCNLQYPGSADPTASQSYIRLARNLDPVIFDAGDGLGPQSYTPFNFEMGEFKLSTNGSIPEMELLASNVMRALQGTIEEFGGIVGANLTLYIVNTATPAGEPDLTMAFTVNQTTCDPKQVHFNLGAASPLRRLFPIHMYRPNFCAWSYKSAQCGYANPAPFTGTTTAGSATVTGVSSMAGIITGQTITGTGIPAGATVLTTSVGSFTLSANATASAAGVALAADFTTCSHTQDGPTGCAAHFPGVALRGLFFPGIDSNGAVVAGAA